MGIKFLLILIKLQMLVYNYILYKLCAIRFIIKRETAQNIS